MGSADSTLLSEEVEEIRKELPQLTVRDIRRLFKRFRRIDREQHGFITRNDILNLPEFVLNPLQERLLDIFPNNEGRINFRLFCRGLAVFHPDATPSAKLHFLFQLYDVDGDGLVSVGDVETLLKSAAGESLTEEEVHKLAVSGLDNQDSVDFQGFALLFPSESAIMRKLSFSFQKQM